MPPIRLRQDCLAGTRRYGNCLTSPSTNSIRAQSKPSTPFSTQNKRIPSKSSILRSQHTVKTPSICTIKTPATLSHRTFSHDTSSQHAASQSTNQQQQKQQQKQQQQTKPPLHKDRGPASKETTQTDFSALNVLGNTPIPSTSVDVCAFDGFLLDSGLRTSDGDGVALVGGEAFVWRPWMAANAADPASTASKANKVVHGDDLRRTKDLSGGVFNARGQFEIKDDAWGLLRAVWPKPDLVILGTGRQIRPLAPSSKNYLQGLGMRVEVLDTRNAASQFNMLATERGVKDIAAVLVPLGFGER